DASFAANTNVTALSGDNSGWQTMRFADSSRSSAYLLGGVLPCYGTCTAPATAALIAKVMLVSNVSGGGGKSSGGGGGFTGLGGCGMLLLCLRRAFHRPSGRMVYTSSAIADVTSASGESMSEYWERVGESIGEPQPIKAEQLAGRPSQTLTKGGFY